MKVISILDIYDELPPDEKEIINGFIIYSVKQNKVSIRAIEVIPEACRKYYSKQFGMNPYGAFVGLACKSCDKWLEFGHDDDCPVGDIMGDFDYQAAYQKIEALKKEASDA